MIRRSFRVAVFAALAFVGAPATAATGGMPFLGGFLQETRVVYPLQVGEWQAVDEHVYDDQALGVSVRYAKESSPARLDVYFYPAGKLGADEVRQASEAERDGIASAREQSGDPVPDLGPLQDFTVTLPDGNLRGHSMDAALVVRDQQWDSAMVVFHHALHFIKGRMSQAAVPGGRERARQELETFMSTLVPALRIVNTGQCGAEYSTWPDRLPSDCAGEAPVDPEVPEGMREIRIEYPPPW